MKCLFLCCCIIFIFNSSAQSITSKENIKSIINSLKSASIRERHSAIFELHRLGKYAIPFLIWEIDDNEKIMIMLQNPKYSYLDPESLKKNYSGVIYAYVIELIMGRKNLVENTNDNSWTLGVTSQNYIYSTGIILKKNGEALTQEDMINIKQIYNNWWKINGGKPIGELRDVWERNIRPLSKTDYQWK